MPGEFVCYIFEIRQGVVPDYRDPDGDEINEYLHTWGLDANSKADRAEALEDLRNAIAMVRAALEGGSPECEVRVIRGGRYLITGGMSSGDEPGELYGALGRLEQAGILCRLGLEAPGENADAAREEMKSDTQDPDDGPAAA